MMNRIVLLLLVFSRWTSAFAPVSNIGFRPVTLYASSEGGGGAAIAKPGIKTDQKTTTVQKSKEKSKAKVHDPISRKEEEFEDPPMFKLMLIGDESYEAEHVAARLCAILNLDEDHATQISTLASEEGAEVMCGTYPFEKAEMYKEQLIRSDPMIFSDVHE